MRTIPLLFALASSMGVHAATWTALPELPRGSAGTVTGDGKAVAFANHLGGTSVHSPASSAAPWVKVRSEASAMSTLVRGDLIAILVDNGVGNAVKYGALGDSVRKTAVFTGATGSLSAIDQDGRRILAIRTGANVSPTLHLSVDSVATNPSFDKAFAPGTGHFWRTLRMPDRWTETGNAKGCIEGRLIVASNASTSFLSRDTGATWSASPMPYLWDCDISGDTIVGKTYGTKRLYVSIDAGASWDSSALGGPLDIAFRGGKLYGYLWQEDTTYDLVVTANLGRSWNTVLEDILPDEEFLAWDGSSLWTIKHGELLRSNNEGRSWSVADSALGQTIVAKMRGFGGDFCVLQRLDHPDSYRPSQGRLWAYDGRGWTLVHERVADFEVMETDTGWALFVLVDTSTRTGSWGPLHVERSYNLKSWQVMPGLETHVGVLGMSKRGLLVGREKDVAIFTSGSKILLDTAWKFDWGSGLSRRGFLVEQDGEFAWSNFGQMSRGTGTDGIYVDNSVKGYATLGSKYGYRLKDTVGAWLADFKPMATTYSLLRPNVASGVVLLRDSIATWNGSDTFALMRPEGERRVLGPAGQGVTQVAYASTRELGSIVAMVDSTFAVADLHGRIWRLDKSGVSGVGPSRPRQAALSYRIGALSLDLPRAAQVRVVVFDGRGRSLGEIADGWFEAGSHPLEVRRVREAAFAVATLDGIRQDPVRLPPSF